MADDIEERRNILRDDDDDSDEEKSDEEEIESCGKKLPWGVRKKIVETAPASSSSAKPRIGDEVSITFVAQLQDGKEISSAKEEKKPYRFVLGSQPRQVVEGLELGIKTMKRGEIAHFTIAPRFAYDDLGSPPLIPPDATLVFEVKLLSWESKVDLFQDDRAVKTIVERGSGDVKPELGQEVLVSVTVNGKGGQVLDQHTDMEHIVGSPDFGLASKIVSQALQHMVEGERATVRLRRFAGDTLVDRTLQGATIELHLQRVFEICDVSPQRDGSIQKKLLRKGTAGKPPAEASVVRLQLSCGDAGRLVEFHVGGGEVCDELEAAVAEMRLGLGRTGRAVSRIPRVPGGGTHRAGQGAFGNMARGGGRAHPTRVWRRWHRRVNIKKKRAAVVTALSASALPPLVMARGHRIGAVAELPLVVSDGIQAVTKTKTAVDYLKKLGCEEELKRIIDSKKVRAGKGKMKNRRYKMRLGPMVIYAEDNGIVRAMRNIPGVQTANVTRLNLLKLAPGGNFGRFLIWTEGAIKKLQEMYGKRDGGICPAKKRFHLPRAVMENADLSRIINSDEVQSALRPKLEPPKTAPKIKRNPLKNKKFMEKLNPGYLKKKELRKRSMTEGTEEHKEVQAKKKARIAASKEYNKVHKRGDNTFYKRLIRAFEPKIEEKAEEAGDD